MYRKGLLAAFIGFVVSLQAIQAQITANFTAAQTTGCAPSPLNVSISNTSTPVGGISTHSWTVFDQGGATIVTAAIPSPTFSFTVPGKYTVRLIVTGPGGVDTLIKPDFIELFAAPTPSFTLSSAEGCTPFSTQLQNTSAANAAGFNSINWTFSPGNIPGASGANPTVSATIPGTYDINLIVVNSNGCQAFTTVAGALVVYPQSTVTFNSPDNTACAAPHTVSFSSTVVANNPLTGGCQWSFPGGTPSSFTGCTPPVIAYSASGNYAVSLTLTATDPSCEVVVTNPAFVSIGSINSDFSAPANVCEGQPATFSAIAPSSGTFEWDFENDGIYDATGTSVNHVYPAAGTFSVKLRVNKGVGCVDSTTKLNIVTVNPSPVADFSLTGTSSRCTAPATFSFNDLSVGATAYAWAFGAQGTPQTSALASPSVTYNTFGLYQATLTVSNAFGCTDSKTQALNVSAPQANFSPSTNGGCVPVTGIVFQDASTANEPIVSWQWTFGNGTGADGILPGSSTVQNPTANVISQGGYDVQLIITTQSGCKDTLIQASIVRGDTVPSIDFAPTGIAVCAHDTTTFTSLFLAPSWTYNWDFEYDPANGFSVKTTGPTVTYVWSDTGSFNVALEIVNNTCPDTLFQMNAITVNSPVANFMADNLILCGLPATFTFTDSTVQPATLWEWYMDGALFLSSPVSTNPSFTFNTVAGIGSHIIKLRVHNSVSGCVDSMQQTISVGAPVAGFSTTDVFGCRAYTASFTNLSTQATAYQWFRNGSGFSTAFSPSLVLPDSGHYNIRLIATDAFGCTDTADQNNLIQVVGPYAQFSSPAVAGCAPLTTSFADNSVTSGGATLTNWLWTFNDPNATVPNPNTSAAINPSHTYNASGSYAVKLKVTDSFGCQDSITKLNFIQPTFPVPNFTAVDASTCAGPGASGVAFNNTSAGVNLTYAWSFGDGNTSTGASPLHVYTPPTPVTADTTFTVKLIATDINGCVDSIEKLNFVTIEAFKAGFVADNTFSDCPPLTANFNDSTSVGNIAAYSWTFGDGSFSAITDPSHTYLLPNSYDVILAVTHPDGCVDSLTQSGFINVDGPRGTMLVAPAIVCPLDTVSFTVNVERTDSVTIVYGDGTFDTMGGLNIASDQVIFKHVYTTPGIKPVTISGALVSCDRVIALESVEVSAPPTASFTASDATPCEDATFALTDATTPGSVPLLSWLWDFGNGSIATAQNPSHMYASGGARTVTLIVTDNRLCKDTATLVLTAQVRPIAAFTPSDTVGCSPKVVTFTDQTTAGDAAISTWVWNFGGGTGNTSQQNPQATFNTDSSYTISLIAGDLNGCTDTVSQFHLLRLRKPTAHLTVSDQHFCENAAITLFGNTTVTDTPLVQYDWTLINTTAIPNTSFGATTTVDSFHTTIAQFGTYTAILVVTDVLGCSDSDTVQAIFRAAAPPIAAISLPTLAGCQPFAISPADISAPGQSPTGGPVVSRFWNFGVPTVTTDTSSLVNPAFTYTQPGSFEIILAIRDSLGCVDTTAASVTVFAKPVANFVSADTVNCAPLLASFTDLSTGAALLNSWSWVFGTAGGSSLQNPTFAFTTDGDYTIELQIEDENGCRDTMLKTNYIRLDHPDAVIGMNRNISCEYDSVTFLATGSLSHLPLTTYAWIITDQGGAVIQTAAVDSFLYAFADTGTYYISLEVTDTKGCTDIQLDTISIIKKRFPDPLLTHWVTVTGDKSIQVNFQRHVETDFFRYYIYRDEVMVDSVSANQADTLYTDLAVNTNISHCYKVQVVNVCGIASDITTTLPHCSMAMQVAQGTDQLSLSWNAYVGWPVERYEIYRTNDYNAPLTTPFDSVPGTALTYLDTATFCHDSIRYRVVAVKAGGNSTNVTRSVSNLKGNAPIHLPPSQRQHVAVATVVGDSSAQIQWPRYTGYKPSYYLLERSLDGQQWDTVAPRLAHPQTLFVDGNTPVGSQPVSYRVTAIDSCGEASPKGRIGRTIYLEVTMPKGAEVPRLTWTPYVEWPNGVTSYTIFLLDENGIGHPVVTLTGDKTSYIDNTELKELMENLSQFCYYVVANQASGGAESVSNIACAVRGPKVVAPNAFTPNGDEGANNKTNNYFVLEDMGTVETWTMQVFDRWGHEVAVVTQNDPGWDGLGRDGKPAQEGVYLYTWTGIGFDGAVITHTGTITLLR